MRLISTLPQVGQAFLPARYGVTGKHWTVHRMFTKLMLMVGRDRVHSRGAIGVAVDRLVAVFWSQLLLVYCVT